MDRASIDVVFGLTLMIAGTLIATPEKLKAKSPSIPPAAASYTAPPSLQRCEAAKAAALAALKKSDYDGYQLWEQRARDDCRMAGF